jgi:putative peptide zinc metalloprotease protein
MAESLFSPHWYRVASLRPRLPPHVRVHRHNYRGVSWYVLEDTAGGRQYRFNRDAEALIAPMDGARTVEQIWDHASAELGDAAPTQNQVIRLLSQLHACDLLLCDLPPDTAELFERQRRATRGRWKSWLMNPLSLRLPLLDPDRFLERALPWVRPLFTRAFAALWLVTVGFAALLAVKHWNALSAHASEQALAPGNLLVLLVLYPIVKTLHELGHGFATKIWGGAVHEIGVMFLLFMPVPYVNASAASAFPERHRRMVVAAAGIAVELLIAALALFLWVNLQPGATRDVALNLILIGGVSTVLFNGNPLLRFDAYYVLADAVGIPGLAARASRYYAYLTQRYLFESRNAESPVSAPGERAWFIVYGLLAFVYRVSLSIAIILYLSTKYFVVGVALALWAGATQLALPLLKGARFVLTNPLLQNNRRRATTMALAVVTIVLLLLFVVPMPLSTHAQGVIWLPEQAQVRAGADGFVEEVLVADGTRVKPGDALVRINDPDVELQLQALDAERLEMELRYFGVLEKDRVAAEGMRQKLRAAEATLQRMRERASEQVIRAKIEGVLTIPDSANLVGRFVKQGEVVGFVVDRDALTARVVVRQSDIGLIRRDRRAVYIIPADDLDSRMTAFMLREVGGTVDRLPSRALGASSGIELDPLDEAGTRTREPIFQIDLALPIDTQWSRIGTRVYARFDHGYEPLAFRWERAVRRQLLRQIAD